ncbi:BLUF domain-containing protein [Alteromonas sp. CYL-A6]|uniref:BLUF domain-containing protein n=1 Tax=Alteromonas nitratireducens TaxID=3390813 RepID=UPI0034C01006
MFLVRLLYASEVSSTFQPADIDHILQAARKNNAEQGLTGMLCFNSRYFLQCLEGSRTAVNHIFTAIMADERHARVVLLDYSELSERAFSAWSMGYIPEASMTAAIRRKYAGSDEFNPYQMSGESAYRMLKELAAIV